MLLKHVYRHPITSSRPSFRDIVIALTEIQERRASKDQDIEHSSHLIGSSTEAWKDVYKDLQDSYVEAKLA